MDKFFDDMHKEMDNLGKLTEIVDYYTNKQDREILLLIADDFNDMNMNINDIIIKIHNFKIERKLRRILNG